MRLINLTPHTVTIETEAGTLLEVPPEPTPARCEQHDTTVDSIVVDGVGQDRHTGLQTIRIVRSEFGVVEGLPEPQEGTLLIVSRLVAEAARGRSDLLIPGPGIRDDQGRIVGCRGLARI